MCLKTTTTTITAKKYIMIYISSPLYTTSVLCDAGNETDQVKIAIKKYKNGWSILRVK